MDMVGIKHLEIERRAKAVEARCNQVSTRRHGVRELSRGQTVGKSEVREPVDRMRRRSVASEDGLKPAAGHSDVVASPSHDRLSGQRGRRCADIKVERTVGRQVRDHQDEAAALSEASFGG